MAGGTRVQGLDLHLGHVDAGRALALAGLAGDAELHRLGHVVAGHGVRAELAGEGKPERVGASAGEVHLVAGNAVGGAHHAGVEFAAGAVVVAHLDRGEQAGARPAGSRLRVVRPIKRGGEARVGGVGRAVAEQHAVVHAGRADDAAGVERAGGVERILHRLERADDAGAEHAFVELGADNAVAVLAAVAALVLAHQGEAFLGDGAHGADVRRVLHVEDGADVQAADAGVGIPGALGAVLREHVVQALGVVGEIRQVDGAVLDEADGFAVALHGHHDVQPGLAHFGDVGLERRVGRADDGAGVAEIGHGAVQLRQLGEQRRVLVAVELDQEQAVRLAQQHAVDGLAVDRDAAAEVDHGAVDQFDAVRIEGDQVAARLHGGAEGGELAYADHLARQHRLQLQLERGGEGEGAFAADQEPSEVFAALAAGAGGQDLDVVAADPAQLVREAGGDLVGFGRTQGAQALDQGGDGCGHLAEVVGHGAEAVLRAVGEDGVDGADVVGHEAVADGFRAAGVVGRHAADGAARLGGGVDGEEQLVRLEGCVQVGEDDAGLHGGDAGVRIHGEHVAQVLGAVQHDGAVDGLAALAGAATAGQHGHAAVPRQCEHGLDVGDGFRHDDGERLHLVDGGVRRVAAAVAGAEQDGALHLAP